MRIMHITRATLMICQFLIPVIQAQKKKGHYVCVCGSEDSDAQKLRDIGIDVFGHQLKRTLNPFGIIKAISQIKKIDKLIDIRRENAQYLTSKLNQIDEITIPKTLDNYFHVYQMYMILVKGGSEVRQQLINYMAEKGISTRIPFSMIHLTRFYREQFACQKLPTTEKVAGQVLVLPIYPLQTEAEMDYISDTVRSFFKYE